MTMINGGGALRSDKTIVSMVTMTTVRLGLLLVQEIYKNFVRKCGIEKAFIECQNFLRISHTTSFCHKASNTIESFGDIR